VSQQIKEILPVAPRRSFVRLIVILVMPLYAALCSAGFAATTRPPALQPPLFTLVNRSPQVIRELFVTPAGNANWGQNHLDGKNGNATAIPIGASFTVRRRADANCIYDIRLVYADANTEDRRGVNICAADSIIVGTVPPAPLDPATGKNGDDPSFRLFNRAAIPIAELYATPSGLTNWGQNRIGQSVLKPDGKLLVALPRDGACYYDLRVVFTDHKAQILKHTNLCKVAEVPVP
jgi:hypothetical protein